MTKQFYTKDRQFTAYALACGYIDITRGLYATTHLSWNGASYDVQTELKSYSGKWWESAQFESLLEARREVRKQQRRAHDYEVANPIVA